MAKTFITELKRLLIDFPESCNYQFNENHKKILRKYLFQAISCDGLYLDWFFPRIFDGLNTAETIFETLDNDAQWLFLKYDEIVLNGLNGQDDHCHLAYHQNLPCARIFRRGEPIYKCLTCGFDETCALCSHCYQSEEHAGHTVHISICQRENGGVCDCGDPEAWIGHFTCKFATDSLNHTSFGSRVIPASFEEAFETTICVLLDYVIDVMSQSDLQLYPPQDLASDPAKYSDLCTLNPEKYGYEDPGDLQHGRPSEMYALIVYNDQVRHFRDAVQRIHLASKKVSEFAIMVAEQVQTHGRATVLRSTDFKLLFERQKVLSATGLASCIRNARDEFQENMCHDILVWLSNLTDREVFKTNETLKNILCHSFCCRWQPGLLRSESHGINQYVKGKLSLDLQIPNVACITSDSSSESHWNFVPSLWDVDPGLCRQCDYNQTVSEYSSRSIRGSRFQYLVYFDIRFWKSIRTVLHDFYLTSLITNLKFKKLFACQYVDIYPAVADLFLNVDGEPELNILSKLSSQLFTCPSHSTSIIAHGDVSRIFLTIFNFLRSGQVQAEAIDTENKKTISMASLKNRRWGQIFFDISYILSRGKDSELILSDNSIPMVCDILSLFQGKPVLRRETEHHVEYESTEYTAFFHAILVVYQFAEYISQSVTNLEKVQRQRISLGAIKYVVSYLLELECESETIFMENNEVDYGNNSKYMQSEPIEKVEDSKVSFLHPLHSFLSWLIEFSNFSTHDQLYSIFEFAIAKVNLEKPEFGNTLWCINMIFDYPIQTVVLSSQIKSGFWVRNGFSVRSQLQLYKNTSLREQGYLRDLFLVQVFTVCSEPDTIMDVFLKKWLFHEWTANSIGSSESCIYELSILQYIIEECLRFFMHILTEDVFLRGLSTEITTYLQIRSEIIHNLCFGPLSYSKLCSQIPEHIYSEKKFDSVLEELTTFKKPITVKDTGVYVLNEIHFAEVDPYYFNYTINKKDDAMKLLKERIKEAKNIQICDVTIDPKSRDVESFGIYRHLANFTTSSLFTEFLVRIIKYIHLEGVSKLDGLLETVLHLIHVCSLENLIDIQRWGSFLDNFLRECPNFQTSLCSSLYELLTNDEYESHHAKIRAIFMTLKNNHVNLIELLQLNVPNFHEDIFNVVVNLPIGESNDERKKRIAKDRQAKLIAKFKKQQSLFSKINNVDNDCSDMDLTEEEEEEGWKFPEPHCILCQDTADDAGPFGIISYVSKSAEFRQVPFSDQFWFLKAFSDLTNLNGSEGCGGSREHYSDNWVSYMALIKRDHVIGPGFTDQELVHNKLVSLTCGHGMHFHCYMQYLTSNKSRLNQITRNNPESAEHREFLCPLCKAISNMFIPILWLANNRSLSKFLSPTPKEKGPFSSVTRESFHDKFWLLEFGRNVTQDLNSFSILTTLAKEMIGMSPSDQALQNQQQFRILLTNMFQILSLLTFPHIFKADCPRNLINSIKSTEISLRGATLQSQLVIHQLTNNNLINLRALNEFRLTSLLMKFSNCVPSQTGQVNPHVKYLSSLQTLTPEFFDSTIIYSDFFEILVSIFPAPSASVDFNSILVSCFMGSILQNLNIIIKGLVTHEFYANNSYTILDVPYSELLTDADAQIACEVYKTLRGSISNDQHEELITNHPKFGFVFYSMLLKSITPFLRRSAIYAYVCCANQDIDTDLSNGELEGDQICSFLKIPKMSEILRRMLIVDEKPTWEAERLMSFKNYMRSMLRREEIISPKTLEYPGLVRLVDLPDRLDEFFTDYYYLEKFHNPHLSIENPAVCMFCAEVLDAQKRSIGSPYGQCSTHFTKECISSVGIFLLPKDRCLLLLHKNGGTFYDAPYLDNHGELPAETKKSRIVRLLRPPVLGWRYTLVVYAGITLSCVIFGLAFRPLKPTTRYTDDDLEPPGTPLLMRIKRARDEQMRQCASALSMSPMNSKTPSRANLEDPWNEGEAAKIATRNAIARTLLERHGGNMHKRYSYPGIMVTGPEPIKEETETPLIEADSKEEADKETEEEWEKQEKQDTQEKQEKQENRVLDDNKNETQIKNDAKECEANGTIPPPTLDPGYGAPQCPRNKSAPVLAQCNMLSMEHLRRPSKLALRTETARPFYRDDIFYSGSMRRLPEYRSSESVEKYHQSVTQLPPMSEIMEEEEEGRRCKCCPTSITSVISRMFDITLLSSPTFIVLGLAGFMSLMALFIPFMFLPGYATQQGISKGSIATLVSTIGITNTIGRIVCGWISDHPKVDALYVNNFSLMLGGGATMLLPVISDESLLLAYAVAFGISVAAFASLRSILLVELLGLEKLTNAFGLLLLFQGIAGIFGSPVAGAFVDMTQSYDITFYVFGGIFAFSGVMCIPLRYIKRWEDNKKSKQQMANGVEMKA